MAVLFSLRDYPSAALAVALSAGLAVATPAVAADIPTIDATIERSADIDMAMTLSGELEAKLHGIIYIDWKVRDDPEEVGCSLEESPQTGYGFNAYGNNHAPIAVIAGDPALFPLNDISCDASGAVRIRGVYYVLQSSIPTANYYELRPVPQSLELIQQVIAGP